MVTYKRIIRLFKVPYIDTVSTDGCHTIFVVRIALYLLHFEVALTLPEDPHFTLKQLLLPLVVFLVKDALDRLEKYFTHGPQHNDIVCAIDGYAFDALADVVLHSEVCVH